MTQIFQLDEIKKVVDPIKVIESIEEGFKALHAGKVNLGPVGHLDFKYEGILHVKYGHIEGDDLYVVKVGSYFKGNNDKSLEPIQASMQIYNAHTGEFEALLLDQGYLTNIRTAAAGAVAAKYLAPRHVETIGIVGTGRQARLQLEYLQYVTECKQVVVWGRNIVSAGAFQKDMAAKGWKVSTTGSVAELIAKANLIVTATAARNPLIPAELVRPGTHITAMGADAKGKQELEPELVAGSDLIVADELNQCLDHGEISHAFNLGLIKRSHVKSLGEIITLGSGRVSDDQITIADLTGVAVQDIQIAKSVYHSLK